MSMSTPNAIHTLPDGAIGWRNERGVGDVMGVFRTKAEAAAAARHEARIAGLEHLIHEYDGSVLEHHDYGGLLAGTAA